MRVKCAQLGGWIHIRCAVVKTVTPKFSINFACKKCEWNIGEAVEQEEKLRDDMETIREFTYLGGRVSAGEGSEAIATTRTRCG